jgi:hypothetical protein
MTSFAVISKPPVISLKTPAPFFENTIQVKGWIENPVVNPDQTHLPLTTS